MQMDCPPASITPRRLDGVAVCLPRLGLARFLVGVFLFALFVPSPVAHSADAPDAVETSPLGIRQEGVQERVRQLEATLLRLARIVRETEPHLAQRLETVLEQTRTLRIEERVAMLTQLLHSEAFGTALAAQDALLADLQALLQGLLEEDELDRLRKRIEELKAFREAVDALAREEWEHMRQSDMHADKDAALEAMQSHLEAIDALIEKQQAQLAENRERMEAGEAVPSASADAQAALAEETRALADAMKKETPDGEPAPHQKTPEPGEAALAEAAGHQDTAANALAENRAQTGASQQEEALERLQEARAEVQAAHDALAASDGDKGAERKEAQEETAAATDALSEAMEESAQQSGEPSAPGAASMGEASASMQEAAGSIGEGENAAAGASQEKAHQELREASKDIQDAITDLEKDKRAALLAYLEALFRRMLETQQQLRARTRTLEEKQESGAWERADEIACATVARDEAELAVPGREAHALLLEDGSATVFPMIVEGLVQDILSAAEHLETGRVDAYTQSIQIMVEQTLEELIEAMQKAQEEGPPPDEEDDGAAQEGEPQPPPLFDVLQELRLLRAAQFRVNRHTEQAGHLPEAERMEDAVRRDLHRLAARQEVIHQALRALLEKATRPAAPPPTPHVEHAPPHAPASPPRARESDALDAPDAPIEEDALDGTDSPEGTPRPDAEGEPAELDAILETL